MDKILIQGGTSLEGTVHISGAKNASLLMLAAVLLTNEPCILRNVPNLRDVNFFVKLLKSLGAEVELLSPNVWRIQAEKIHTNPPYDLVRQMRASICLMGPLTGRLGQAALPLPGGCIIGNRPIDLHLHGLKKLGCTVELKNGIVHIHTQQLKGNHVFLGGRFGSTVTGTANILMAATLSSGITRIENTACEPEIVDLCHLLTRMGARIEGIGSPQLIIYGQPKLHGADHTLIGDRIEAGTFLIASLITNGHLIIDQFHTQHLGALLHVLENSGAKMNIRADQIEVFPCLSQLTPFEITTLPYPGFPTDLQAQMCVLAACIPDLSLLTERIYPQRFMHVAELQRLGVHIILEGSTAIVQGGQKLSGADVMASDLRASAALYLAGLIARGETQVHRIYHLDRGYENFEQKLQALGAKLCRTTE
ncbi:MAG: UDP-N-acetylglucosamine 1-carboxyvinyltransferase [Puniceicoccales bacterium]|jgi:UDP-N-acetylglucosamine 1-carboxyvinyltransferase|nr:UDP-N-acetylglucosamine 1-carboxyvinyltransferase [Puniceicoccales bacterium]